MTDWDYSTDILVVGSGGGGMTAALVAKDLGNESMIIEKGSYYGGSTAISGGALWVPNNHLMKQVGIKDTPEEAFIYLKTIVDDRVDEDRLKAFLDTAPEMVKYLEDNSHVKYRIVKGYSDYHYEIEGAKTDGGRTIEPVKFSILNLEKPLRSQLRTLMAQAIFFGKIMIDATEGCQLAGTTLQARFMVVRMLLSYLFNPFRFFAKFDTRLTLGNALIARLRLSLYERDIPLWLNTAAMRLIVEDKKVIGLEARKDKKTIFIRVKKGIILAAGGFERNQAMRDKYHSPPSNSEWSLGNPGNTGDAIKMGIEAGAALELMDCLWWMPVTMVPGDSMPWYAKDSWWEKIAKEPGSKMAWFNIADRCMPRGIIVNSKGRRFANEAEPYLDFIHNLLRCHREDANAIPSWMIVDQKFYRNYPLGPVLPNFPIKKYIQNGFLKTYDTLEGLAAKCDMDPEGLKDEIKKYNQYAKDGVDKDFHKGETAIDRYYADPRVKPNPCMGPIEKPPFYAMKVFPGDVGTKGGLLTDAKARVLREDGSVIEGLYATGNCAASVMGDTYPGAGGTIAPAMTFGYIAALHAAGLRTE